ncbi:MAG: DUF1738 domain-containing protein [Melioribacteraceae bacterium]|nr:DUF1738 domain-containing protein [Melioribacteraceae bacterium]
MKRKDIYNRVNTIIQEKLSAGNLPWRKSWKAAKPPQNFFSKHFYQGINFLLLSCFDFPSPYYLTFLQCKERSGSVLKGEKGIPIIFWKLIDSTLQDENGELKVDKIPYMRFTTVFNLSQTSLYNNSFQSDLKYPDVEKFISTIPAVIKNNSKARCFFNVSKDFISIPVISEFISTDEYYSSLFHEIIHWTGHQTRLNRFESADYNSDDYSKEELVAEIGSAYLCSLFGINNTLDNSAAYIQGLLNKLQSDESLFISASSQAKKAVNYLLNNKK